MSKRSRKEAKRSRYADKPVYETTAEIRKRILLVKGAKCVRCGETEERLLEFHHVDHTTKVTTVADMISRYHWLPTWDNWDRLVREVHKCIILCRECHVKYHQGKWTYDPRGINYK